MQICFLTIGTKSPQWLENLVQEYNKKISYWISTNWKSISSPALGRDAQDKKKSEESESILIELKPDDYVILCDEKGSSFGSMDFAKKIEKILNGGKKRLVIIIGGPFGVGQEVKKRADLQLSLSTFTINHQLALAVICEQIYRAMTILKGTAYHND